PGDDAEEPGEREVVAGDRRQLLRETAGVGAREHGELRHRDVELLAAAALDVDVDVDALRAGRGRARPRRGHRREREDGDQAPDTRSSHVVTSSPWGRGRTAARRSARLL